MEETILMSDIGLTDVALEVNDIDKSILFYEKYARMKVDLVASCSQEERAFIRALIS